MAPWPTEEIIERPDCRTRTLCHNAIRRMFRRCTFRHGWTLLAALRRPESTPTVLKGVLTTTARPASQEWASALTTGVTGPERWDPTCARGISSSAIIFRFMQRWEEVEETLDRLDRRRLLSGRHLCAAFRILRTLPRRPSDAFLQKLYHMTQQHLPQFDAGDIADVFAATGLLGCNEVCLLEDLTQHLLSNALHLHMSRSNLVHLLCSLRLSRCAHFARTCRRDVVGKGQRVLTFASYVALKEALVAEVLRPSRRKKFTERQLYWILFSFDRLRPVPFEAAEKILRELSIPLRQMHLSATDKVQIATTFTSLHQQKSAVVDAWMAKLVEPENLKQYTSSDLYRLFDTVLTLRPEDRPTLLAAVAELRRPNRTDRFSPVTISTITEKLLSHGYLKEETVPSFWRYGHIAGEDPNDRKKPSSLSQANTTTTLHG